MSGLIVALSSVLIAGAGDRAEISFDIWDWTEPCKNIALFDTWVSDLAAMGVTRIEISVPWRALEPEAGRIDLQWLEERLAVCKRHNLGMRLRINSYYGGATPAWYDGDTWIAEDGSPAQGAPPSIMDERFWAHYGPLCTAIARHCRGEDVYFNAFIGIHAELKWADWWHYDAATLARWRAAIQHPRPEWLQDVVDDSEALPERPLIPAHTQGIPDTLPASRAIIAFREWCWREAVRRFEAAIRVGDPDAKISAPLGESYRIGSAQMSNCDYWGLSRGAAQVVHSYDFFQHGGDGAWEAAASVDAFRGITGLPVSFEYDSEGSTLGLGYSIPHLMALGRQAARAGAGLKIANYSYHAPLPSARSLPPLLIQQWRDSTPRASYRTNHQTGRESTVLLFFSKWANYSYREPAGQHGFGWLHDAQFGVYKLFQDLGIPVRIVCEDNLNEDLSGYRAVFMALSPPALMPRSAREKLASLALPRIADYEDIPPLRTALSPPQAQGLAAVRLVDDSAPIGPADFSGMAGYAFGLEADGATFAAYRPGHVVLGYPIGLIYQTDAHPYTHQGLVLWALQQADRRE